MQVPLADGQSKILGTLEVNWNINLITRNKGIWKQEILLLEFCKNDPRILRPLQITFSRWNQIQIWLQEISGYNKQQEDCSICYFNFGPTGDPPLSNSNKINFVWTLPFVLYWVVMLHMCAINNKAGWSALESCNSCTWMLQQLRLNAATFALESCNICV